MTVVFTRGYACAHCPLSICICDCMAMFVNRVLKQNCHRDVSFSRPPAVTAAYNVVLCFLFQSSRALWSVLHKQLGMLTVFRFFFFALFCLYAFLSSLLSVCHRNYLTTRISSPFSLGALVVVAVRLLIKS